ncbi:MAG TPA: hypothetical protein VLJ37_10070 [bacterium]|nr:hypothetical protein [bacterium]
MKIEHSLSHVAAFDEDPVLNRVQMSLGMAGGDVGAYVLQAGNGGGAQGAAMMNQLVGLMMQRPLQGGAQHQSTQGSSAGPAVAAGAGGLALGVAGGALLSQLGKKKDATAADPIPGGGSAATGGGVPKVQSQASAAPTTAVAPVTTPVNSASGSPTKVQTPTPMPTPTKPTSASVSNTWSSQPGVDTSGKARSQASLNANGDLVVTQADDLSKTSGSGSSTPWKTVDTPNNGPTLAVPSSLLNLGTQPQVVPQNAPSSDQWKTVDTANGSLSLPSSLGGK